MSCTPGAGGWRRWPPGRWLAHFDRNAGGRYSGRDGEPRARAPGGTWERCGGLYSGIYCQGKAFPGEIAVSLNAHARFTAGKFPGWTDCNRGMNGGGEKTPHFRVEVGRVEGKQSVGYCTVTATGAEEIPLATT